LPAEKLKERNINKVLHVSRETGIKEMGTIKKMEATKEYD
jgi:hypothetical protein